LIQAFNTLADDSQLIELASWHTLAELSRQPPYFLTFTGILSQSHSHASSQPQIVALQPIVYVSMCTFLIYFSFISAMIF